ncbi:MULTISPECIES: hypothetical protein [unclassified Rhizobium]|uniref:hypothetical protein n=1 Tax=unclassified Rhizobium TaxID=2613769 RepID=UPI00161FBB70|nr:MULTISPECIES: hypothetical protein [unclassified Rhizobium]MBB3381549.1 hypothetical protein [Rhizobium sp. BK098]MBB3613251.1 hypothetical protein [Rhizobium sp. BK609]MBB3678909.1 hypothetical protein [Rhizobium sp. BK612]
MDLPQLTDLLSGALQSTAFNNLALGAFGAFFGAWGAQAVISSGQRRQLVVAELNSINAALNLCFSICNVYGSQKKQHALPMLESIEKIRAERDAIAEKNKVLSAPLSLVLQSPLDLRTISPVKTPIELLERLVFEKIAMQGRGLAAFNALVGAVHNLNAAIDFREALLIDFKRQNLPSDQSIPFYLGDRNSVGHSDTRYPDSVKAINLYASDCIFFAKTLAEDLSRHGAAVRKKHSSWFRDSLPKLSEMDLSPMLKAGLLPPDKDYENWLAGFPKEQSRTR